VNGVMSVLYDSKRAIEHVDTPLSVRHGMRGVIDRRLALRLPICAGEL
jgi:hypothetical protein